MQEVATDNGMTPVNGEAKSTSNDVGGLIAAVESKMSELMAWQSRLVGQAPQVNESPTRTLEGELPVGSG